MFIIGPHGSSLTRSRKRGNEGPANRGAEVKRLPRHVRAMHAEFPKLNPFPGTPRSHRFLGIANRQSWERCAPRLHRPTSGPNREVIAGGSDFDPARVGVF